MAPVHVNHTSSRAEFDSHADTCVLGPNFIMLSDTGQTCTVNPYLSSYQAVNNIKIISGATAIQHHVTGEIYILVYNQSLWFGDNPNMTHSLINQNQVRAHGHNVQDNPFDTAALAMRANGINIPL